MSIAESTLAGWSHHEAGTAFKQAHLPIRKAMQEHKGLSQFTYEVFLQGSYRVPTRTTLTREETATSMWSSVWPTSSVLTWLLSRGRSCRRTIRTGPLTDSGSCFDEMR